jgi:hypothetical protein
MNSWESLIKKKIAKEGQLILKKTSYEHNILYELATNNKKNL